MALVRWPLLADPVENNSCQGLAYRKDDKRLVVVTILGVTFSYRDGIDPLRWVAMIPVSILAISNGA